MLDVVKVDHIGIRISDREASLKFYELLGYRLVTDDDFEKGHPIILKHPAGPVLNLLGPATGKAGENILMDEPQKYPGYTHMALQVSSVADAKVLFDANNVAITGSHQFNDLDAIFVRDPDRNVIEIVEHTGPGAISAPGN